MLVLTTPFKRENLLRGFEGNVSKIYVNNDIFSSVIFFTNSISEFEKTS